MNDRLKESDDSSRERGTSLLGVSPEISGLQDRICRLAKTSLSVLLVGETGVGKDLVAREVHRATRELGERIGSFVVLHCVDVPHEFQGFEAFFELASGGTLFIDGVDELSPSLQAKLLRILETREIAPAGLPVDARIIASARGCVNALRDARNIHSGLFFRFECVIEIPPLRARGTDVRVLADHYLAGLGSSQQFSPAAYQALEQYPWPGNVRELHSRIRNVSALHTDMAVLTPECLFGGERPDTPNEVVQDELLDYNWERAQEEFKRWYWTNLWRRFGRQPQRILDHARVSGVWLRQMRKRFGLFGGEE